MNRIELTRKLIQLRKDYNNKLQEIDRKSVEREQKKLNELYDNAIINIQKPSKTEQNQTIPEIEEELTPRQKETKDLLSKWYFYEHYQKNEKPIWRLYFPQWFRDLMESE